MAEIHSLRLVLAVARRFVDVTRRADSPDTTAALFTVLCQEVDRHDASMAPTPEPPAWRYPVLSAEEAERQARGRHG